MTGQIILLLGALNSEQATIPNYKKDLIRSEIRKEERKQGVVRKNYTKRRNLLRER